MTSHPHISRLIQRQFAEGLGTEERAELMAHLRECPACQRVYDRFSGAEQLLFAGPDGEVADWTGGAQDRVEATLFGEPRPRRPWLAPLALASTALAAAAALLIVPSSAPEAEVFTPRGAMAPPTALADTAQVGLRALRIRASEAGPQVADLATAGVDLGPRDHVALLYVNHEGATRVRAWLDPGAGRPVVPLVAERPARNGVEDARLGDPLPAEGWPSGTLTLVAEFTGPKGERWTRRVDVTKAARR